MFDKKVCYTCGVIFKKETGKMVPFTFYSDWHGATVEKRYFCSNHAPAFDYANNGWTHKLEYYRNNVPVDEKGRVSEPCNCPSNEVPITDETREQLKKMGVGVEFAKFPKGELLEFSFVPIDLGNKKPTTKKPAKKK